MKFLFSVVPFEAVGVGCVGGVHLVFRLGVWGSVFTQVTPGHVGDSWVWTLARQPAELT